jgi:hypothetical protein
MIQPSLEEIKYICDQIARAEGYGEKDAIPTDARNPGDLMLGNRFDCVAMHKGIEYVGRINGVTIYPKADRNTYLLDPGDGYAALWREIASIFNGRSIFYHVGMTIQEIADLWTKTEPEAWAKNVADGCGVSTDTKLSDIKISLA